MKAKDNPIKKKNQKRYTFSNQMQRSKIHGEITLARIFNDNY
jgi:hypothetical protein